MRTPKTKIDGGTAWRWYAEPQPDLTYLAVATVIELRSMWSLPRFEWYSRRVHRQLGRTPGLVGFSFQAQFPLRYWTLSAWEDGRALHGFLRAGPHQTVRTTLPPTIQTFQHVHWKVSGAAIPLAWADGLTRLQQTTNTITDPEGRTP